MRYLLLIYTQETDETPPDDVAAASHAAYAAFTRDVRERGILQAGEALTPTSTATTVRLVDGQVIATDGPFAETKEALGGFYLIEANDLDHALAVAKLCPAPNGGVEVRPVLDTSGG